MPWYVEDEVLVARYVAADVQMPAVAEVASAAVFVSELGHDIGKGCVSAVLSVGGCSVIAFPWLVRSDLWFNLLRILTSHLRDQAVEFLAPGGLVQSRLGSTHLAWISLDRVRRKRR